MVPDWQKINPPVAYESLLCPNECTLQSLTVQALSEILPRVRNSPPPPEGSSDQLITEHLLIVTDLSNMIPEMAIAPPPAKPY
jgi:hypothetical protein